MTLTDETMTEGPNDHDQKHNGLTFSYQQTVKQHHFPHEHYEAQKRNKDDLSLHKTYIIQQLQKIKAHNCHNQKSQQRLKEISTTS